jgi:hypothetical protein
MGAGHILIDGANRTWTSQLGLTNNSPASSSIPLTVAGASSQSADLSVWKNIGGTALVRIKADGSVVFPLMSSAPSSPSAGQSILIRLLQN